MRADLTLLNRMIEDGELFAAIHLFDDMIMEKTIRRRSDVVKTKERLLAMILITDISILTDGRFGALRFNKRTNSLLIKRKHKASRIAAALLFFICGLALGSGTSTDLLGGILNLFQNYLGGI